MSRETIPPQMKAVVLDTYTGLESLRVEQKPVPRPGPNEVLVKVKASPINPSDLSFIEGNYGFRKPTPVVPGFEGSGEVVAVGSGMMAGYLNGKRVACVSQDKSDGVWAEYMVTKANLALPLDRTVSFEQGACSVVNPLTAMAFLEIIQTGGHKSIVQTAAASVLGQMISRMCQRAGIEVIQIVRREAQAEMLRKEGAKIVLNSHDSTFDQQLTEICHQHKARLAFDAVAGPLTMRLVDAMPPKSKVIVYGGLSYAPAQADPRKLIFQGKSIEGFWLTTWLARKNFIQSLLLWQRAQRLIMTELKSDIRMQVPLQEVQDAIRQYQSQMTGGKILLVPEQ